MFIFKDNGSMYLVMTLLTATHFGGCSGDIYDLLLYVFKFKDETTLMIDTGPKQVFYTK